MIKSREIKKAVQYIPKKPHQKEVSHYVPLHIKELVIDNQTTSKSEVAKHS